MMNDTAITFRTNSETKAEAQHIFADLGMDISTALNVFLKKVVRTGSIPFEVTLNDEPNETTLAALDEVYNHPELSDGPYATKKEILEALASRRKTFAVKKSISRKNRKPQ
ncbi:type II toxin-antitoxin system RelB/DinJ family antitoxin [Candidatus Saccharibacteria bacterium]|nr:type II toxin-antitoxin system RelB/DinJ family antitoxin [Candidatus Saccharibacteria bacterium]